MSTLTRWSLIAVAAIPSASAFSAPARAQSGVFILDNCDDKYDGKENYEDRLTLVDSAGDVMFRVSGFNNCESIGSSRMIAADAKRRCVWVIENVGHRVRRFDLQGQETLVIPDIKGSALAVDTETGNLCVLENEGQIGAGVAAIYDTEGKRIAAWDAPGWDVVYDRAGKSYWIAQKKLTRISAADGQAAFSVDISTWCASSVDVNADGKSAWVAVRRHPQVQGSQNQLLKIDADGRKIAVVDLGDKSPFRVSLDPVDASLWVAQWGKSVERYSPVGELISEYPLAALAIQVDAAGDGIWVVTANENQKITRRGEVLQRVRHAGPSSQAWIAPLR